MKVIILRGKRKGEIAEVSQWCNDWFTLEDESKVYSPSALLFDAEGMKEIKSHNNNGILFGLYEIYMNERHGRLIDRKLYILSFRKRKHL